MIVMLGCVTGISFGFKKFSEASVSWVFFSLTQLSWQNKIRKNLVRSKIFDHESKFLVFNFPLLTIIELARKDLRGKN